MQNKFSQERVESIMESLGGLQPAVAPDFFYTRLKGKIQPEEKKIFFKLRPVFITTALAVLLMVNVFSLLMMNNAPTQDPAARQNTPAAAATPATIESFAKAYDMNNGSVYE